jgi:transposase
MKTRPPQTCRRCSELEQRNLELRAENDQLLGKIESLQEQIAELQTDSSTSHKPPSSDIVKPPNETPDSPRKIGGQPGHPGHFRKPYSPDELTGSCHYKHQQCPDCGGQIETSTQPVYTLQQIDIAEIKHTIVEHCSYESWCPQCQKMIRSSIPESIERHGMFGPQLRALIAYLKGMCHASFSTIRKYLRDVMQIKVSRGYLAKVISQVSEALEEPYEELLHELVNQPILNVDETSHPHNKERWWTWCFRAELFVVYRVDPTRKADVLIEVLKQDFKYSGPRKLDRRLSYNGVPRKGRHDDT